MFSKNKIYYIPIAPLYEMLNQSKLKAFGARVHVCMCVPVHMCNACFWNKVQSNTSFGVATVCKYWHGSEITVNENRAWFEAMHVRKVYKGLRKPMCIVCDTCPFQPSECYPQVFGEVIERNFCPRTKWSNANDHVVLLEFRHHLLAYTFWICKISFW